MKKGLERVVQRKVLRVSRGYQKGDCEFAVFWDLVPCGLTEGYWRFRRTCCTHVSEPWWWGQSIPLKWQCVWPRVHCFTSQKTVICFW